MPVNNREAFQLLQRPDENGYEVGFIAVGIFETKKNAWISHFTSLRGREPTYVEIDDWISNLPLAEYESFRAEAVGWLDAAARELLESEIELEKRRAVADSILQRVKDSTNAWKSFGIGVAASVFGSLVFAALVIGVWWIAVRDPSPIGLARDAGLTPVPQAPAGPPQGQPGSTPP